MQCVRVFTGMSWILWPCVNKRPSDPDTKVSFIPVLFVSSHTLNWCGKNWATEALIHSGNYKCKRAGDGIQTNQLLKRWIIDVSGNWMSDDEVETPADLIGCRSSEQTWFLPVVVPVFLWWEAQSIFNQKMMCFLWLDFTVGFFSSFLFLSVRSFSQRWF